MSYLGQDRMADAASLAVTMVRVFEALKIGREALAAWCLFVAATTQRQEATLDFAQRLARYLQGARRDPEFVFSTAG